MPKVSPSHLEARRRGILRAALRCFSRNGLHATTMRDICRAANLSPGAVYRYFAGKREIVVALGGLWGDQVSAFLAGRPARGSAPRVLAERVVAMLEATESDEGNEALRLEIVLWGEALRDPEVAAALRAGNRALVERLAELVRRGIARGEIDPGLEPESLARVTLAVFEGLAVQLALDPESDAAVLEQAVFALFRGLSAP